MSRATAQADDSRAEENSSLHKHSVITTDNATTCELPRATCVGDFNAEPCTEVAPAQLREPLPATWSLTISSGRAWRKSRRDQRAHHSADRELAAKRQDVFSAGGDVPREGECLVPSTNN